MSVGALMLIWIVGCSGILGGSFCKLLHEKNIPFFSTTKDQADITDLSALQKIIQKKNPTHIINCAAYTEVEKAEEEEEKAFLVNSQGIANLASVSRGKLIHFSTDYVFDGKKKTPYLEEDDPCPINVYGKSKLAGEKILFKMKTNALCIRISWLFGGENDFVSKILKLMNQKKSLSMVYDQIGVPCYAKDVAAFTLGMLEREGIYHYSSLESSSWYEFAKEIFFLTNKKKSLLCEEIKPIVTKDFKTKARRPLYSVLGSSKIHFQAKNPRTWKCALKEYIDG